ncbi:MAG: hypothetical protein ABIH01_04320, partial [Candidatus Omnitrophota bacterium]
MRNRAQILNLPAILLFFFALLVPKQADAAVKEVKISAELDNRMFMRSGVGAYDADGDLVNDGQTGSEEFLLSTTDLYLDAQLSDNVSAHLLLENQKNWGHDTSFDVLIQNAYVELKEFFYAPLTVTMGLQPLEFGRGFILSSCGCAWDTTLPPSGFASIKATLDYAPWTIDAVYIK